jgi:penicillin amidase
VASPFSPKSRFFRRAAAVLGGLALLLVLIAGAGLGYGAWVMARSRAQLEGRVAIAGLSAPVTITRDVLGVPTIVAANRIDLARALGFLHGQERFFEMDLLRRAGAGELSALVGAAALHVDERRRLHRFRARALVALARQAPAARALGAAYAAGVNAGLAALPHAPWEYTLLRVSPVPWTEADTYLVVDAMYFDLQDSEPGDQQIRGSEQAMLGPDWTAFLNPHFTPLDAPIDGSMPPPPPIPAALPRLSQPAALLPPRPEHGSNDFAVSGRLSATGSAIVANDMHLGLTVPNIWYRARMMVRPGQDTAPALDLVGVTLPGSPFLVVGSNRHVAWGFTDSYIETGDAVVLDPVDGDRTRYATPDGPRPIVVTHETICAAHGGCEDYPVSDTIWGPVAATDRAGRQIVWAWTAHDANAVATEGFAGLETARTVREAMDAAHLAGLPQENLAVGDSAGHVGWTIIGQVPRRVGLDDQMPHSWADGTHGWKGFLTAGEIPEVIDPPDGRIWTANGRVVGGAALEKLGDGGYADGLRAGRIRDELRARQSFTEADLLAIQTDTRATAMDVWQGLMRKAIAAHADDAKIAAMRPYVEAWGGRAVPDSVGYRLVHASRAAAIRLVYGGLVRGVSAALGGAPLPVPHRGDWPVENLLLAAPAAVVPPPYTDWNAVSGAILRQVQDMVEEDGGDLSRFTYGRMNRTGIHHPLARVIPLLGLVTDPPDVPVAGDTMIPRVAVPGDGASERIVVSPGHEESGIFDMPVGQAANPLSPYFGLEEQAWVDGRATPLLPGSAKWVLVLVPGGS